MKIGRDMCEERETEKEREGSTTWISPEGAREERWRSGEVAVEVEAGAGSNSKQRRSQAGDAAVELDAGSWGSGEVARFGNDGDDRLSCCSGWRGSEARELVLLGDGRLGA